MNINSINGTNFRGTIHIEHDGDDINVTALKDANGKSIGFDKNTYHKIVGYNPKYDSYNLTINTDDITDLYKFEDMQGITYHVPQYDAYVTLESTAFDNDIINSYTAACQNKKINVTI